MRDAPTTTWPELRELLSESLGEDDFWAGYFGEVNSCRLGGRSVHLAIFVEPFLTYVLEGQKTIESRFSVVRCAPYLRVEAGDILVLKRSGGPVQGVSLVEHVWTYNLDPESWVEVKSFADALCASDPSFWSRREGAAYATLMRLNHVRPVPDLPFRKRDRRGWVVLKERDELPFKR